MLAEFSKRLVRKLKIKCPPPPQQFKKRNQVVDRSTDTNINNY